MATTPQATRTALRALRSSPNIEIPAVAARGGPTRRKLRRWAETLPSRGRCAAAAAAKLKEPPAADFSEHRDLPALRAQLRTCPPGAARVAAETTTKHKAALSGAATWVGRDHQSGVAQRNDDGTVSTIANAASCQIRRSARSQSERPRRMTATSDAAAPALLAHLSQDPATAVRSLIMRSARCTQWLTLALADDEAPAVRASVASERRCPQPTLRRLAADEDPEVAQEAARNPGCGEETLRLLARHRALKVAEAAIMHRACPPEEVRDAAASRSYRRRFAAASSVACPPQTLQELLQDDEPELRAAVAGNSRTPPDLIAAAAADAHPLVRSRAMRNPACPLAAIETLAEDSVPWLATAAAEILAERRSAARE